MMGILLLELLASIGLFVLAQRQGVSIGRVMPVLITAVPPLASSAWALTFRVAPASIPPPPPPAWHIQMLQVFFWVSIALGITAVIWAKGFRPLAAIFAGLQIPLTLFLMFLGVMEVTGNWI